MYLYIYIGFDGSNPGEGLKNLRFFFRIGQKNDSVIVMKLHVYKAYFI